MADTQNVPTPIMNAKILESLDRDQITVIARQRIRALTSILRNNQTLTD